MVFRRLAAVARKFRRLSSFPATTLCFRVSLSCSELSVSNCMTPQGMVMNVAAGEGGDEGDSRRWRLVEFGPARVSPTRRRREDEFRPIAPLAQSLLHSAAWSSDHQKGSIKAACAPENGEKEEVAAVG